MKNKALQILALAIAASPAAAWAQTPKDGTYISTEDIQAVLKHAADTKRAIPDNSIRIVDMGNYQLGVAVIHRGALGGTANPGGNAAPANPAPACGEQRSGATGPNGILHDDTAESYVVISGGATLIMGGTIVNGRRSAADSEVTTILNGPSCSGTMVGYTSKQVKTGDVIVIPEGVPHGFSAIPDHITYLSIRPGSEEGPAARLRESGAQELARVRRIADANVQCPPEEKGGRYKFPRIVETKRMAGGRMVGSR